MLHVHFPSDFEGELHIYVDADSDSDTSAPDREHKSLPSNVEKILGRFESHDSASAAREVLEKLVARGWVAIAPTRNDGKVSAAAYVRLVYKGSNREVSVFLNTVSLVYARKDAKLLASKIDGSELHADGSLYVYHSEGRAQKALTNMETLEEWADGKLEK